MAREIYEECRLASVRKELERVELELQKVKKTLEQSMQEKPWPHDGREYYHISADGRVFSDTWCGDEWDLLAQSQSIYKTKEQAEQIAQNRKVHTMLKELADFVPDWGDIGMKKYFITWNNSAHKALTSLEWSSQLPSIIYFKTQEDAQKAISTITEEFGVDAIELYCKHGVI